MYGIFTCMCHNSEPNVGMYIHIPYIDPMGTCTCSEQLLSKAPLWFKLKKLFLLESVFVKVAETWQEGDVMNADDGVGCFFLL